MESLLFLLGLLLLALPVIAIVALIRTITLGEHFRRLDARLAAIERGTAAAIRDEPVPAAAPPPAPPPIPPTMEEAPQAAVPPTPEPPARAPIAAPRPAPEAAAPMSLEQRLGTQWTVWVGGLALALGGIFLVRYSIEQGLLGPRVRLALAALLATALIISGEWARRTQRLARVASLPRANIPSILIAAGTTVVNPSPFATLLNKTLLSTRMSAGGTSAVCAIDSLVLPVFTADSSLGKMVSFGAGAASALR